MIRGTTPTLTMKLPSNVSVRDIALAKVSIEQSGKEKICKTFPSPDAIIDSDNNSIAVKLTQEETLSLSARSKASVQLKIKTTEGTVLASLLTPMVVTDVINEEVM